MLNEASFGLTPAIKFQILEAYFVGLVLIPLTVLIYSMRNSTPARFTVTRQKSAKSFSPSSDLNIEK